MVEESKVPASAIKVSPFTPKQMSREREDGLSQENPVTSPANKSEQQKHQAATKANAAVKTISSLMSFEKIPEAPALLVQQVSLNDTLLVEPNENSAAKSEASNGVSMSQKSQKSKRKVSPKTTDFFFGPLDS